MLEIALSQFASKKRGKRPGFELYRDKSKKIDLECYKQFIEQVFSKQDLLRRIFYINYINYLFEYQYNNECIG